MNHICLVGRLTADPELKTTGSGIDVCSFNLAVNRPHVKDAVDFIPCVVWRQSAKYLSTYGRKGNYVSATGNLISQKWQDDKGNNRISWNVNVEECSVLSSKSAESDSSSGSVNYTPESEKPTTAISTLPDGNVTYTADDESDLPF